jgi:type VI secretion system protein ImpA
MSKPGHAVAPPPHDWMRPITPDAPCGADLEYDPEFVVLTSSVSARMEAQYGDFVGMPEPINWSEVERDCRRLMMRSKDMRLVVIFTRCRARLAGPVGMAEGLSVLAAWLDVFTSVLHPHLEVDDDPDAARQIRTNALQALTDADGLLGDVREIVLARASATHLRVRDVERAFAFPRPNDALAPESVIRQIADLRVRQPDLLMAFDQALASLQSIDTWGRENLGAHAPDLSALLRLLGHIVNAGKGPIESPCPEAVVEEVVQVVDPGADPLPEIGEGVSEPVVVERAVASAGASMDRHFASERIREARVWFEQHEPSSPIPLLLRRAEQFVGKPYIETVKAIPPELLEQWEKEYI